MVSPDSSHRIFKYHSKNTNWKINKCSTTYFFFPSPTSNFILSVPLIVYTKTNLHSFYFCFLLKAFQTFLKRLLGFCFIFSYFFNLSYRISSSIPTTDLFPFMHFLTESTDSLNKITLANPAVQIIELHYTLQSNLGHIPGDIFTFLCSLSSSFKVRRDLALYPPAKLNPLNPV